MGNDNRTIKRVFIFGNGKLSFQFLEDVREGDYIIGVDRAAYWLIQHGIIPDAAIGDFDSATRHEVDLIKKSIKTIKTYPRKKDKTDMELAMRYAARMSTKEVFIFGATGGRLDHMLATLNMLGKHILADEHNKVYLIGCGKTTIERSSYRYISILPYTKSITVTLTGFRYPAVRKKIRKGTTIGISNELVRDKGIIQIFSGKTWIIESRD